VIRAGGQIGNEITVIAFNPPLYGTFLALILACEAVNPRQEQLTQHRREAMRHTTNMKKHARKGAHQVRAAAHDLKATARNHAGSIAGTFQRMGTDTVEAVKEGVDDLRERVTDYAKQGRATAQSMEESLEETIHERPLAAMMTALGIGFVMGMVFARR
jgi:ElaB/YqjD/DUF883 family membrane-anchored ribosome-binding protein